MGPEGHRQLQTDGRRFDHPNHLEKTNEVRGKLPGLSLQREVLGREPNLLAWPVRGCWCPVVTYSALDLGRRTQKSCTHLSPDPFAAVDDGLDQRDGDLLFLVVEQGDWYLRQASKWRNPRSRQDQGVVRVFHPG